MELNMQTIFTVDYDNSFNVRLVAFCHQPENDFYEYVLYIGEMKFRLVCKKAFLEGWLITNKKDSHAIFSLLFDDIFVDCVIEGQDTCLKTMSFSTLKLIEKECDLLDDLDKVEFVRTLLKATRLKINHFID